MTSPRKVDNKNPMRSKMLKYLREHPQELKYIVGDYLAKNKIIQKAKKEVFDNIDELIDVDHPLNEVYKQLKKKHLKKL